jgi:tellurite resistance protein
MNEEPSRLHLLRFARRVVVQQATAALAQIDGWITAEERREAERRRGEEMRPPPPEWLIQHGLNRANVDAVHTGACWAAAKSGRCRPATRQQALEALRQQVPACVHCRPDTVLGILD